MLILSAMFLPGRVSSRLLLVLVLVCYRYSWYFVVCLAYMFFKEGREVLTKGPFHHFNSGLGA